MINNCVEFFSHLSTVEYFTSKITYVRNQKNYFYLARILTPIYFTVTKQKKIIINMESNGICCCIAPLLPSPPSLCTPTSMYLLLPCSVLSFRSARRTVSRVICVVMGSLSPGRQVVTIISFHISVNRRISVSRLDSI